MHGRMRWARWQPAGRAVWTPWHTAPGGRTLCGQRHGEVRVLETTDVRPAGPACDPCEKRVAWYDRLESRVGHGTL